MSPLEIHCLLEYYAMPDGSPDIHHRHPMAIERLLNMGLIAGTNADTSKPMHTITDKGKAHVAHLMALPMPVQSWTLIEPFEPGSWVPNRFTEPDTA